MGGGGKGGVEGGSRKTLGSGCGKGPLGCGGKPLGSGVRRRGRRKLHRVSCHIPLDMGEHMPVRLRRAEGEVRKARFLQFLARGGGRERLFHKIEAVHPLQYPRRAAEERRLARLHEQKQRHADLPAGGLCLGERERVALGLAERQQRAGEAEGRGGQADGGAQLHQALGEVAAAPLRQGGLQFFLERSFQRLGGAGVAQQAGKDADDVAVYGGGGFLEGDGDDRPRRVVADAGQLFPALRRIGEAFRRHDARRLLQVAGAGIIAEAFP